MMRDVVIDGTGRLDDEILPGRGQTSQGQARGSLVCSQRVLG